MTIDTPTYKKEELITYNDTPCFAETRHIIKKGGKFTLDYAPTVWICLEGNAVIKGEGYEKKIRKGDFFYLPFIAKNKFIVETDTQATLIECLPSKQD